MCPLRRASPSSRQNKPMGHMKAWGLTATENSVMAASRNPDEARRFDVGFYCLKEHFHVISVFSHVTGSERVDVRRPLDSGLKNVAECRCQCPPLKPPPRAILQQPNVPPHIAPLSLLYLCCLLGVIGACTVHCLSCCLTHDKTGRTFSRGTHQQQPSNFYNLALARALLQ
jgi:hypothetical protein